MTEEKEVNVEKTVRYSLFPSLLVCMFVLLALTGNCSTCGLDRDYLGDTIDTWREEKGKNR